MAVQVGKKTGFFEYEQLTTLVPKDSFSEQIRVVSDFTKNKVKNIVELYKFTDLKLKELKRNSEKNKASTKLSAESIFQDMIVKSAAGGSGFTFIGQVTPSSISGCKFMLEFSQSNNQTAYAIVDNQYQKKFTEHSIKLIFKWAEEEDQFIQSQYNQIYRYLGFISAIATFPKKKKTLIIEKICQKALEAFRPAETQKLTVTLGFEGENLERIVQKGIFTRFSREDLESFFFQFGRIACVDFLLGNFDRVINYVDGKICPKWNCGNIMLDIPTKRLYFIDNGISSGLLPKERADVDMDKGIFCEDFDQKEPVEQQLDPSLSPSQDPVEEASKKLSIINDGFAQLLKINSSSDKIIEFEAISFDVVKDFFSCCPDMEKLDNDFIVQYASVWKKGVLCMLEELKLHKLSIEGIVNQIFTDDSKFHQNLKQTLLKNVFML